MAARKIRVLLAKPGLDGHDRGVKVVAYALRDAGMEVIYLGLKQTVEQIVTAAVAEDVDVIGLSILSGAHVSLCEKLMKRLEEVGRKDILVCVGGNILKSEFGPLRSLGVQGIFPVETPLEEVVDFIRANAPAR